MANPYQIEDWESMASVRSKLNQMGEAVENSMQNPIWWEEWQVLTKTATWTEWWDSEGGNTQTFSISWNTDKENAKLALDYYMAGNTPILRYNNKLYFLNAIWPGTTDANRYLFFICPENSTTSNVHNFIYLYYYTDETVRSLSIWNNTAYFVRWNYTASVVSALPSSPGSNTLYFITA